jgi:hypothetical protein
VFLKKLEKIPSVGHPAMRAPVAIFHGSSVIGGRRTFEEFLDQHYAQIQVGIIHIPGIEMQLPDELRAQPVPILPKIDAEVESFPVLGYCRIYLAAFPVPEISRIAIFTDRRE